MGTASSNLKKQQNIISKQAVVEGHWVNDIKTGYRWATDPIISDSTVVKSPNKISGETWGPYKKQYTLSSFGQKLFTPPESVDGHPLLCRCRDIENYIHEKKGGLKIQGAIALSEGNPTCWDDTTSPWDALGGDTFTVTVNHPLFYQSMVYRHLGLKPLFGGKKTLKNKKHVDYSVNKKTRRNNNRRNN